jgi:PAS domain S-box-containing protein
MAMPKRPATGRTKRRKERRVALGIRGWRVPVHSHISYLWNGDEEFAEAVGFLDAGARANEHRLLVGTGDARKRIVELLRERAVDVEDLQAAGRITLLDAAPSAEDFVDSIVAVFRKAIAGGASFIRFLGVPEWGEKSWPDHRTLLSFEGRLTRLAREFPSLILCLYDVRSLPGDVLEHGGFRKHPLVISGGQLVEQVKPIAPADFVMSVTRAVQSAAERARAEAALAESEARFATVFHASPVALAMSTITEGRIIDVNERWLELFGYRRDEVIGLTNRELDIMADPEARGPVVQRARDEGVVRDLEMQVRRKSGEVRDLIVSAVRVDRGTEDESWLSAQVDITDRKRAEAERDRLLESATAARGQAEAALERLRAIQSITDSAVVHLTLDAMLQELLARLRRTLDAEYAIVLLVDEEHQTLYPRAVDGHIHESIALLRIPLGKGVSGRVAQTGQPLILDDLSTIDVSGIEGIPPRDVLSVAQSMMAAPLKIEGKVIGVVSVGSARRRRFTREELELLLLVADRAAPAVERARLMETVHTAHDRLEALSRRLVQVQETERAEIARELHDEVGQLLTGLSLMVEAGDSDAESRRGEVKKVVNELIARVRDLSVSLRPPMLDALGLLPALLWQIERFETQSRIRVAFHHANLDRRFPSEVETAAFRIVQEALTNVARHASVERVEVEVTAEATRLRARNEDRGRGFDVGAALAGPSSGLAGMRERARLLGGRLTMDSTPGSGTRLRLVLPLTETTSGKAGK